MRYAALAALLIVCGALSALDDLSTISFHDGKERSLANFAGQTVIVVPLNGKC